jgi:prepilin-type processing-associated H-X9-DG protein
MSVRGKELAGIIVIIGIAFVLALPAIRNAAPGNAQAACANNLKQIGLSMKMYANESHGERYPPLSRIRNNFIFDVNVMYPEYLTDLSLLIDQASPFAHNKTFHSQTTGQLHPDCVSGLFYNYTGFLLIGEPQAVAWHMAYESSDLAVFTDDDHRLFTPNWENVDPAAALCVLWDRVPLVDGEFSHRSPRGVNGLMMDGHVEFVQYSPFNHSNLFPASYLGSQLFGGVQPKMPGHCY